MTTTDFVARLSFGLMAITNVCVAFVAFAKLKAIRQNRPILLIAVGYGLGCVGTLLTVFMHYGVTREPIRYALWWTSTLLALPTMLFCTVGTIQLIRGINDAAKDENA